MGEKAAEAALSRLGGALAGAPWYAIAIIFALTGQAIAAAALSATGADGTALETVLTLVFVLQAALIAIAFATSGLNFTKILAAIGALLVALGCGMILFVLLQCNLNGICL